MAINFSASFAACLAAGLKVPRQIMYCISQDTGAPYVLYKDSQEAAERNGLTGGQWGSDMYPNPSMQQTPQQAHLTNHHTPQIPPPPQQQQQQPASQSPPVEDRANGQTNGGANALPSPATSPFPQTNAATELEDEVSTINQVKLYYFNIFNVKHFNRDIIFYRYHQCNSSINKLHHKT